MWHDDSTIVSDYELFVIMYDYGLSCIELHGYAVLCWVMYKYVTLCDNPTIINCDQRWGSKEIIQIE